jgi:hypothetical protein
MKKFLFFAIATAMLGMTFTSCDNEKDNAKEDEPKKTYSLDGRWDCAPNGWVGIGEQRITLIFNGSNVDVYIVAWGDHLKGTYTYENNKLNFSFRIEDALDALYVHEGSRGWFFGDGALDPETFELTYTDALPYRWYPMNEDVFNTDVDWLKDFEFRIIDEETAEGGPMHMTFYKRSKTEKTALEGKWVKSERTNYANNGYADRVESFTFNRNTFILESSNTGVNPQGESWGSGHKITGSVTVVRSSFTITVEKFYSFNNSDEQFAWKEQNEGTVGQSFTFSYEFEEGDSLGVTAPSGFASGAGSYLGSEKVKYGKE